MKCLTYPIQTLKDYRYTVILSFYQGKIMLSKHKLRDTYETQGGKIEPGETPLEGAKRELYEESGAIEFDIYPLCDYWYGKEDTGKKGNGRVFVANIKKIGALPESEMEKVEFFDELPSNLTYPLITPVLFKYWRNHHE
mgnify:FL=1